MDSELCESGMTIATIVVGFVSTGALRGGQGEWGKLNWVLQH